MAGDTSQTATALLTEHLQYTPLSLIDDIINSVNSLVYQGISSLENGLLSTPPDRLGFAPALPNSDSVPMSEDGPDYPSAKQEIEEGLHKLETLLESTVDKNFDKFEIYVLRNILSVPHDLAGWIRLSHYENLTFPPPIDAPTPDSVQLLRRRAIASQMLTANLQREALRNEAIIAQLQALTSSKSPNKDAMIDQGQIAQQPNFSFLTSSPSSTAFNISTNQPAQQPLTTNTTFTLSQLPSLRALLADLRSKLASLQFTEPNLHSAVQERHQERRDYIEQRTRLHLNRNGRARADNPSGVNGRRVDPEEVEALEKVASIFAVQ